MAGRAICVVVGLLAGTAPEPTAASRPATRPTSRPTDSAHREARELFEEGVRLLTDRQYPEAIRSLRASIRRHPDGPHIAKARTYIGIADRGIRERQARRFFGQGVTQLRQEKYKDAIRSLRTCIRLCPGGPNVARAREYLETLDQVGRSRLSVAEGLLTQKRYVLAHEQFQAVAEEFSGLSAGEEAGRRATALEASPEYLQAKNEADAEVLLEKARARDREKQYYFAWDWYRRLVEAYPNTAAAEEARKRLAEITGDPTLVDVIRQQRAEHEASQWFAMAENYRQNAESLTGAPRARFIARAREYYTRIITVHPSVALAVKAKAALAKLTELDRN